MRCSSFSSQKFTARVWFYSKISLVVGSFHWKKYASSWYFSPSNVCLSRPSSFLKRIRSQSDRFLPTNAPPVGISYSKECAAHRTSFLRRICCPSDHFHQKNMLPVRLISWIECAVVALSNDPNFPNHWLLFLMILEQFIRKLNEGLILVNQILIYYYTALGFQLQYHLSVKSTIDL